MYHSKVIGLMLSLTVGSRLLPIVLELGMYHSKGEMILLVRALAGTQGLPIVLMYHSEVM